MNKYKRASLARIKTISIATRASKVSVDAFARPFDETADSFRAFVRGLPDILCARDLRTLVDDIRRSRREGKPVILMMGAHVIKVGLAPVIVDLLERGVLTHVAMNSAAAIHDVESALWGKTSEDVAANLRDGTFGMARETGSFINGTLKRAYRKRKPGPGYGEALASRLLEVRARNAHASVLAACQRLAVPVTVHAAIGTDIVHQQPSMDGAATGALSFRDFLCLAESCKGLVQGGVVLNVGSAVILPEVFLKALTVARNLGADARGFTTAVFDMHVHYRPAVNVQLRPTLEGGRGYYFVGHHEIMIPLLAAMISLEIPR